MSVCAQWRDRAGNRSAVGTDTATVELGSPSTTPPTVAFEPDTRLTEASMQLPITWTGSDAESGVASYLVRQSFRGLADFGQPL